MKIFQKFGVLALVAVAATAHADEPVVRTLSCVGQYDQTNQPGVFGLGSSFDVVADGQAVKERIVLRGSFEGRVVMTVERVTDYQGFQADGYAIRIEHKMKPLLGSYRNVSAAESFIDDLGVANLSAGGVVYATAVSNKGNINWLSIKCYSR